MNKEEKKEEETELKDKAEPKKIKVKDGYEEVEASNWVEFNTLGDSVEGMLIEKGDSETYGFGLYTLMTPEEGRKRFHGTTQLDDLMADVNEQDYICVTLIDFQNMPKGKMKLFSVQRKKE